MNFKKINWTFFFSKFDIFPKNEEFFSIIKIFTTKIQKMAFLNQDFLRTIAARSGETADTSEQVHQKDVEASVIQKTLLINTKRRKDLVLGDLPARPESKTILRMYCLNPNTNM